MPVRLAQSVTMPVLCDYVATDLCLYTSAGVIVSGDTDQNTPLRFSVCFFVSFGDPQEWGSCQQREHSGCIGQAARVAEGRCGEGEG